VPASRPATKVPRRAAPPPARAAAAKKRGTAALSPERRRLVGRLLAVLAHRARALRQVRPPAPLRLVPRRGQERLGLRVVAALESKPPFPVDARVYEEDTYLVLSAPA
jgi:hypothetical protein